MPADVLGLRRNEPGERVPLSGLKMIIGTLFFN